MKDTGEQTIQITLDELGPKRFLEWLRAQSDVPVEHIVKAHRLPFVQVMREFEHWYCDYLYSVVRSKIEEEDFDVLHISVGNHRTEFADNWIEALYNELIYILESEFGISGMKPRAFVSAMISHSEKSIKFLTKNLDRYREMSVVNGNVPEQVIRASCLLCREWENLTNLLFEMICYLKPGSFNADSPIWFRKLKFLANFSHTNDPSSPNYFGSLLDGDGSVRECKNIEPVTIDYRMPVILNSIRCIRNKVAHPSDLTVEDIEHLAEYSEYVLRKLKNACPLIARVVSVKEDANGLKEVGIYTEVDQKRKQPRYLPYVDVFETGDEPDPDWIGKEVIIFPTVIEDGKYMIKVEAPAILLRKQEFVESIHSVTETPLTISITYTPKESASETYISSQAISLDE